MCECSTYQSRPSKAAERDPNALAIRVADMTCGQCAGTITEAIETGLPGAKVEADPASKIVSVHGATDLAAVEALVARAGYTPGAA